LILDCVNDADEIEPIAVVTDNGGVMRSMVVARPHFVHVRTRYRSPGTNGVAERFFEALKYERLFRHDIGDGDHLAAHVAGFIDEYNQIRPHENLDWWRPAVVYLDDPTNSRTLKPSDPETQQEA
jgi:transposase InsO family protein